MASILTVDKKGRTTLPEEVRYSLGLNPGDFILCERTERGTYELVPASLVPRDQLWFRHPQMQRRVAEAEAQIAQGKVTRTKSPAEGQAFLDRLKKRPRRHK